MFIVGAAAIPGPDVVRYGRLMAADETGTFARIDILLAEVVGRLVTKHGGRIFALGEDGVLNELGAVIDVAQCAIDIKRGIAKRGADRAGEAVIAGAIGINLGDGIIDGEIRGNGLNTAARLDGIADEYGIKVVCSVCDQIRDGPDFSLEGLGGQRSRSIPRPVRVPRVLDEKQADQAAVRLPGSCPISHDPEVRHVLIGVS